MAEGQAAPFPDPRAVSAAESAASRFREFWVGKGPLGEAVQQWISELFGGDHLEAAFLAHRSHPLVHLPVWAARQIGLDDPDLLSDLTLSSIHGYLFIRLIDNVMDDDAAPAPRALLPALAVLHSQFERPYHQRFEPDTAFWAGFDREWTETATAAVLDARAATIDETFFSEVSGRKTRAMMIPASAVLRLGGGPELEPAWEAATAAFGRWQQFHNDFFGAHKDAAHGTATFLTSQAAIRAEDGESPYAWLRREGFAWGAQHMQSLGDSMATAVDASGSPHFAEYVRSRMVDADTRAGEVVEVARLLHDSPVPEGTAAER